MMIEIPETAADAIVEAANAYGCSPAQYIEALLHYAISRHKRPGSWEAAIPFDPLTYLHPDSVADRWFTKQP